MMCGTGHICSWCNFWYLNVMYIVHFITCVCFDGHFPGEPKLASSPSFLHLFWKRHLGVSHCRWRMFLWASCPPWRQLTVSKCWREHEAVTPASGLALASTGFLREKQLFPLYQLFDTCTCIIDKGWKLEVLQHTWKMNSKAFKTTVENARTAKCASYLWCAESQVSQLAPSNLWVLKLLDYTTAFELSDLEL